MRQLTDDTIRDFTTSLVEYLENHPATFDDKREVTGEGYDNLSVFIEKELGPYSNGYMNCN